MRLYHTGPAEVREPDIRRGRRNADFGPGFYLTPDAAFAHRWGGPDAVVSEYELDESGLLIRRFVRDGEWFRYILLNRRGTDTLSADAVIGPIANDTIFETFGIVTSGFLKPADAMKLLMIGPAYTQVAIKTDKAAGRLRWIGSARTEKPDPAARRAEQEAFDAKFAAVIRGITGEI